jgi:methylmalonyl-CoA mutase, N-terminal domain
VLTPQLLQHEFGITNAADPLGGSWHVERLTDELETEARRLIEHIDELGGAVAAIESGFYQQTIADEAYARERRIASGEDVVVGVNRYADEAAPLPERFDVPADVASGQREALAELRAERDQGAVDAALGDLGDAAASEENALPAIVAAVEAEATLGEICGALRQVFGDYRPAVAAQI